MEKNKTGCLLVHGFGGGHYEIDGIVPHIEKSGFIVRRASLAGHTGKRKDLRNGGYAQWIESAEKELEKLMEECENVHVIGFSMGGLIGINLALKHKISSITTINTPVYYWDIELIVKNITNDIKKGEYLNIKRYVKSSGKFPIKALLNFKILLKKTKKRMPLVKTPFLVIQSVDDDTVRKTSSNYIYDNISSRVKSLEYVEGGGHQVLQSEYKHEVGTLIEEFLRRVGDKVS
ncbi:alpha/beta hydrolase [Peptoclostridium litorale]|uniref:alpha/beta hydrolase n=1 Tax=Peptoclostridium litorale TaxID=1557 RepID=UPI00056E3074|nr:alpha/beta fold hydrolase [Peptoclostridium litorale]